MLHLPDAIFHMAYEQTSRGRRTEQLAGIDWRWAPLAMVSDVLSYVVQAVRLQLLLKSVGKIESRRPPERRADVFHLKTCNAG
jgi:hypothetical protein